jgi:hypothetical protein
MKIPTRLLLIALLIAAISSQTAPVSKGTYYNA